MCLHQHRRWQKLQHSQSRWMLKLLKLTVHGVALKPDQSQSEVQFLKCADSLQDYANFRVYYIFVFRGNLIPSLGRGHRTSRPSSKRQQQDLINTKLPLLVKRSKNTVATLQTLSTRLYSRWPSAFCGAKAERGWALQCTAHIQRLSLTAVWTAVCIAYALVWSWTWAWLTAGAPAEHGESLEHHFVEEERHRFVLQLVLQ